MVGISCTLPMKHHACKREYIGSLRTYEPADFSRAEYQIKTLRRRDTASRAWDVGNCEAEGTLRVPSASLMQARS